MSESMNRTPTPPSVTGRRRRFTGAHPYPALPQSRLPLVRGVLWITWAGFLAVVDSVRDALPGGRKRRPASSVASSSQSGARPTRVPSLTPTG